MYIYAISDKLSKKLQEPFHSESNEMAIRIFSSVVKNPHTIISSKPEDFSLIKVGEWDNQSGIIGHEYELIIEAKDIV